MALVFGSVCSGIGAPECAWHPLGWRSAFMSEIDAFPRAVLAHHYPEVPLHGDFTTIQAGEYDPIDLLVGGTPCQSFSVAGLRGGMADARGNLALEFIKLADRLKPRFVVWENVPGVLSSNEGKDFACFLDGLEAIGYVVDVDILDAQFFGLAQRRRRVFVCAVRADHILKARTLSSALTVAQCLTEISLLCLTVHSPQSAPASDDLAFNASTPRLSLQKRMRLFALEQDGQASILADSLGVLQASCGCVDDGLASLHGNPSAEGSRSFEATRSSALNGATGNWPDEYQSTEPSLNGKLAGLLATANECITSTAANGTTDQKIYSCALTVLHIAEHITQSMSWCPSFWSAASSALTSIEAFTNYARSASSDLFTDPQWLQPWSDFVAQAERAGNALRCLRDRPYAGSVLPIAESLRGDPAPRRETGERVAPTIAARTRGGGGLGTDFDCDGGLIADTLNASGKAAGSATQQDAESGLLVAFGGNNTAGPIDVATALNASHTASGRQDFETETFIATTLRARNGARGVDSDCTDTLVPIAFDTTQITSPSNYSRPQPGEPCHPLAAGAHPPAVAFHGSQDPDVSGEVTHPVGRNQGQETCAMVGAAVRRLTPRECEKLQGFPPDYTLIPYRRGIAKDGPRYRALGNSMAVPVMRWIGRRIAAQHPHPQEDTPHAP